MCGIALIFAHTGKAPPVKKRELEAMSRVMAARGPDGDGLWMEKDGRAGMAHRRLAIIDPSPKGAQPMTLKGKKDGDLVIVFNGEIYNYKELRAALEAKGCVFRSNSDTEVLLHLYRQEGRAMVGRLRGMYAFALWDEEKNGVLLARDPFGIKPLYYYDDGRTLRAASQVKALVAGGAPVEAESAGHVGFLLWGYVPEPFTLYRNIRALPAGTTLWVDRRGMAEPETFFSIGAELSMAAERSGGNISEALRDSVKHHLVADVPVGLFLSAGIDSTVLASFAHKEVGRELKAFTLGFEEYAGTPEDEAPLAGALARALGIDHRTHTVRRSDFEKEGKKILAAMDQPSIDGVNTYFVARAAAKQKIKVALSGLGGDELFGGYPSFRQIPSLVRRIQPFHFLYPLGRHLRLVTAPILGALTSPKYASLFELGTRFGDVYLLRRGMFMPWEIARILGEDAAQEGWKKLNTLNALRDTLERPTSPYAKVATLEMAWYMRNQLLRDADWAGMAHGVEIRTPFLDVPFFRALAPAMAGVKPPTKSDLAEAAPDTLPDEILKRPKTGFCVPVREWLLGQEGRARGSRAMERGLRGWARAVYDALPHKLTA